jgi:hypothetical protein
MYAPFGPIWPEALVILLFKVALLSRDRKAVSSNFGYGSLSINNSSITNRGVLPIIELKQNTGYTQSPRA